MGRNDDCFLHTSFMIFFPKLSICFEMNFIPVTPAGKCEAKSQAKANA